MNQIEKVARPDAAIENLTNHQQQADMDGTFVKVSRQALDEVLSFIAAMPPVPTEPVAWMYEHSDDSRVVVPLTERAEHLTERGWTETPLYALPTPPAGGSDD